MRFSNRLPYGLSLIGDSVVRKEAHYTRQESIDVLEKLAHYLIANPQPDIVPIYNFQRLPRKGVAYRYQYDMMRLGLISDIEKDIINLMERGWRSWNDLSHVIAGLPAYHVDYPGLIPFISKVIQEDRYHDIHGGNFMIDMEGNYRLIDIEGFIHNIEGFNDPRNKWFLQPGRNSHRVTGQSL